MSTLASDDFTRDDSIFWGTSSSGFVWQFAAANFIDNFYIENDTGIFYGLGDGNSQILNGGLLLLGNVTSGDTEVYTECYMARPDVSFFGCAARFGGTSEDSSSQNFYYARVGTPVNQFHTFVNTPPLVWFENDSYGPTADIDFVLTAGHTYAMRFRVTGDTNPLLQVKVWDVLDSEPGSWTLEWTDDNTSPYITNARITGAGRFGLIACQYDGARADLAFSTFTATDLNAATPLANDDFTRTNASDWGTAVSGGDWAETATSATGNWTITSNAGRINGDNGIFLLGSGTAGTVDLTTQSVIVDPDNDIFGLIARSASDASTYYAAKLNAPESKLTLVRADISPFIGELATLDFVATADTIYKLRFLVTGRIKPRLRAKVWASTDTEPADWMLSYSDNDGLQLESDGQYGLFGEEDGTTGHLKFTSFSVARPTPLAQEDFTRADHVPWGFSAEGDEWGFNSVDAPIIVPNWTITSNAGQVNGTGGYYLLGGVAGDVELFTESPLVNLSVDLFGLLARTEAQRGPDSSFRNFTLIDQAKWTYKDANYGYQAIVDPSVPELRIYRQGDTSVTLASTDFTYIENTIYRLRFRVIGDAEPFLQAKVWAATDVEPAWMVEVVDNDGNQLSPANDYYGSRFGIIGQENGDPGHLHFTSFIASTVSDEPDGDEGGGGSTSLASIGNGRFARIA